MKRAHWLAEIDKHEVRWYMRPEQPRDQLRALTLWNHQREALHARYRWPPEKLASWRLLQLRALADWAYRAVPFYRSRYKAAGYEPGAIRSLSDFEKLPTVTKRDVSRGFESMVSREHDREQCRWYTSTGSTGKPVQLLMQQDRTEHDTLHRFRMFELMSGTPLRPDRWLYNINHATWWHTSFLGQYPVFTISQRIGGDALARHVARLRPQFVSTVTSALDKLRDRGVNLRALGVGAVSTNSETSTRAQRDAYERALGVPVLDEYSSEEVGLMAFECGRGDYHLIEDDVYVELIRERGSERARVVGTDLWNFAMPMIRYEQNDLADLARVSGRCRCGSHFRKVARILGRADDFFVRRDGGRVSSGELLEAAELLLADDASGLAEFRVTQDASDRLTLFAEPRRGRRPSPSHLKRFKSRLEALLGGALALEVRPLSGFPAGEQAKRKIFHNRTGA